MSSEENESSNNSTSTESSVNNTDNEEYFFNENIENNTVSLDTESIFNTQNTGSIDYIYTEHYFNIPENFYRNVDYSNFDFPTNNSYNLNIRNIFDQMYPILLNDVINYIDSEIIEEVMERTLNETTNERNQNEFITFDSKMYKELIEDTKNKDCSICLLDFEDEHLVSLTKCNHLFHNHCITEWSRYKKDCPICRENLKDEVNRERVNEPI